MSTNGVNAVQESIPQRVYWAPLADNFYDADGRGQGVEFYRKWKPRCAEFPQGESAGWGPGSAHNPFKDRPRNAGVKEPSADKLLGDLLARIHRDGGHYVMEHGWQKAAEDAETKVLTDRRALALACFEDEGKIAFYVAAAEAEQADASGVQGAPAAEPKGGA